VDVPGDKLPSVASGALAAYLRETTAPQVPEQLRAAFMAAIDAGRLRSMLNKQMTLKPLHRPGALLLGDAFNMRYAAHLCYVCRSHEPCANILLLCSGCRCQVATHSSRWHQLMPVLQLSVSASLSPHLQASILNAIPLFCSLQQVNAYTL
jgi:hypothetical protein